jgi:hypothetical protein
MSYVYAESSATIDVYDQLQLNFNTLLLLSIEYKTVGISSP